MSEELNSQDKEDFYPLSGIYFYLTDQCNLACRHCWIDPSHLNVLQATRYIPLDLVKSIIREALPLGLHTIKLTGGEPLLHPNILEILSVAKNEKLVLNIETNGILVDDKFILSLKECKTPFISVSLDGAGAEIHEWMRGVPGSFTKAIRSIQLLGENGLRPQIIMSLVRRNVDQIPELIKIAEEIGAGSIKFNITQPSGRGENLHKSGELLTINEYIKINHRIENLNKESKIPLVFSIPKAFQGMHAIFKETGGCSRCNINQIIGVLSDGSYALCGIGEMTPELIFGHSGDCNLSEIWRSHPVINNIREGLPERLKGICKECAMKNVCLGYCLAQNYVHHKDLWTPYWFCERAEKEGLFPEHRKKPLFVRHDCHR